MEAVRPRPSLVQIENDDEPQSDLPLDAPPAPFPVDLLNTSSSAGSSTSVNPPKLPSATDTHHDVHLDLGPVQQSCVQALSLLIPESPTSSTQPLPPLSLTDSQLAGALTELLEVSYELESLHPFQAGAPSTPNMEPASLDDLVKQMEELQRIARRREGEEMLGSRKGQDGGLHPAIGAVREELAWARIDVLSHAIIDLVNNRQHRPPASTPLNGREHGVAGLGLSGHQDLPPSYTQHDDTTQPPQYLQQYDAELSDSHLDEKDEKDDKATASSSLNGSRQNDHSFSPAGREKLLADFDEMSNAIERLQTTNPRLEEQRSELRDRQRSRGEIIARMERDKMRELEEIWKLIERTHGRRRNADGTRVDMEEVEVRRRERRRKWFEELVETSQAGRMSNQDADAPVEGVNRDLAKAGELRDRDRFLKELVEQGEAGRLTDQDATKVEGSQLGLNRRQAFIDGIIETAQNGRHKTQDRPVSAETRLETKRQALVESLVDFGSAGRLHDQDSNPPTPRHRETPPHDPSELVTMRDFFRDTKPPVDDTQTNGHGRKRSDSDEGKNSDEPKKQGTLKKFAGMVRRRSLGISLKGTEADMSSVSYLVEHQENLLAVQIMLHGAGLSLKDDLRVETVKSTHTGSGDTEAIVLNTRDPTVSLLIDLPTPVASGQTSVLQQQDFHLETKLSALPTQSNGAIFSLNTVVQHPLSASDLRQAKPQALCCTACDREIADLTKANKSETAVEGSGFKDLPSEHWAEMLEVWMCHDDPAFTSQLAQRTTEGFWPTRENVLVGGSYILIHSEEAKTANLAVESINTDSWAVVKCLCGEVLGKKRDKQAKYGSGTLRFSKWAVALLLEEDQGESVEPVRTTLSAFIMADLLELAQAHATYRFIISDEEENKPRLLIWIFNPSVKISYRTTSVASPSPLKHSASASSDTDRRSGSRRSSSASASSSKESAKVISKTLRAAKIMYTQVDDQRSSDAMPGFGGAKQAGQVEVVTYPRDVCTRLVNALNESNAVYPAGRRKMGGLQVGFLERV